MSREQHAVSAAEPTWISTFDRPHVLIGVAGTERVIGKRPKQVDSSSRGGWEALESAAAFRREIAVYAAARGGAFEHLLLPDLVSTDHRTFFACRQIEDVVDDPPLTDTVREATLLALVEFQTRLKLREPIRDRVVLGATRSLAYAVLRRSLGIVRRTLGWRTACRCAAVYWKARAAQPRLPRGFAIHGDFSRKNTLVTSDGRVYFIDFRTLFFDNRWPLIDIVRYAVRFADGVVQVDTRSVHAYLAAIGRLGDGQLRPAINVGAQLRVSLLRWLLWGIAGRGSAESKAARARFLVDVVLDDEAFASWYPAAFGLSADSPPAATAPPVER